MKIYISLLIIVTSIKLYAQQQPQITQYTTNRFMYNPAVAGCDGYTSIFLISRNQWVGIDKAPRTYHLSFQTRLLKRAHVVIKKRDNDNDVVLPRHGRVGIGGSVYTDRNGVFEKSGASFAYSYNLFIRSSEVSFGLSGGIMQVRFNENGITFRDQNDPIAISGFNRTMYLPDISAGAHILDRRFFAGISVSQLSESYIKIGNETYKNFQLKRHYYLTAGYRIYLNQDYELEPSFLLKTSEIFKPQLDLSVKVYSSSLWWGGLAYRNGSSFSVIVGAKVQSLYIGYSYDYGFSMLQRFTFGTHEIILGMKFGDNARRYRWLDRY